MLDDDLDELLSGEEKALLLELYAAWELYPQAFEFPPSGLDTPPLSQGESSTVRLNPPAARLRTLAEAGLIVLKQPNPLIQKGIGPWR